MKKGHWQFYEEIEWVKAINNWKYGQPTYLVHLITQFNIPNVLKPTIGQIINGELKQTKRGVSQQKITPAERLTVALEVEKTDDRLCEQLRDNLACEHEVSVATIKKWESELARLVRSWPNF